MSKTNINQPIICLVAGKSAGHILPAITIANQIKKQAETCQILFISNQTALDYQVLNHNPIINQHVGINLINLPYKQFWLLPKFIYQLFYAGYCAWKILKKQNISQIISTGGIISIPVCLIAKYLKIPIIIYELNVEPGKATNFLAKFSDQIKICFAKTSTYLPKYQTKCELITYPTRFNNHDYELTKSQALQIIKQKNASFNQTNQTILILGGSQGSLFINQTFAKLINQNPALKIQVIHQTGSQDQTNWPEFYAKHQIANITFSYESNLMPYYILADLIICRSGAGTLAEILPLKTKTITIPLKTGYTSHQIDNALEIAKNYPYITVLEQSEIQTNFNLFYQAVIADLAPKS